MSTHPALKVAAAFGCAAALLGCAGTPTERSYGDAVRHNLAQQRVAPAPAPDVDPGTDGRRLETVMGVYRSYVGDPLRVVGEFLPVVEQGQ